MCSGAASLQGAPRMPSLSSQEGEGEKAGGKEGKEGSVGN